MFCLEASRSSALMGCLGLATCFVGSLYVLPKRLRDLDHSDPRQIKARFVATGVVSALAPLSLIWWKSPNNDAVASCESSGSLSAPSLLSLIGIRSESFALASALPLTLFVILFAGPMVDLALQFRRKKGAWNRYSDDSTNGGKLSDVPPMGCFETISLFFQNLPDSPVAALRNIIIAPLLEELVFRCVFAALLTAGGFSERGVIWISPLFFGVAHLHHCYGSVKSGRATLSRALVISLVQFMYTSLFGALEMFLFLRTRHLVAVFAVHSWCNLLGLPSLSFLGKGHENYQFRVLIGTAYVVGLSAFAACLFPFTNPSWYANDVYCK